MKWWTRTEIARPGRRTDNETSFIPCRVNAFVRRWTRLCFAPSQLKAVSIKEWYRVYYLTTLLRFRE